MSEEADLPLKVRLWGVRGSTPSPGPKTVRYGGNTPCVSVETGDGKCLVLDAGTGIRILGQYLAPRDEQIFILLTHEHWDHVQGFPFFAPLYQKGRKMVSFPVERGLDMLCTLIAQMDGAHFPVTHEQLPSIHECHQGDPMEYLSHHGFIISRHRTNHPGKCYGYRIDHSDHSIVFMPDNELKASINRWTSMAEIAEFCHEADVLLHDAQFMPTDMPHKKGWGHSLVSEACELAALAKVKHLILFHHDPDRTDDELDKIQADCREWFAANAPGTQVTAGYEGLIVNL